MYNLLTGEKLETGKIEQAAKVAGFGLLSTIINTTLALTGGIHHTLASMNNIMMAEEPKEPKQLDK